MSDKPLTEKEVLDLINDRLADLDLRVQEKARDAVEKTLALPSTLDKVAQSPAFEHTVRVGSRKYIKEALSVVGAGALLTALSSVVPYCQSQQHLNSAKEHAQAASTKANEAIGIADGAFRTADNLKEMIEGEKARILEKLPVAAGQLIKDLGGLDASKINTAIERLRGTRTPIEIQSYSIDAYTNSNWIRREDPRQWYMPTRDIVEVRLPKEAINPRVAYALSQVDLREMGQGDPRHVMDIVTWGPQENVDATVLDLRDGVLRFRPCLRMFFNATPDRPHPSSTHGMTVRFICIIQWDYPTPASATSPESK